MYRMGIWLIAIALMLNGVTAYAWGGLSAMPVTVAQEHHGGSGTADCDVHSNDVAAIAEHSGQPHGGVHDHLKCCATCTVVSLLPMAAAVPVSFAYTAAVFHTAQLDLVGHPVALDPDIPKSIV